LIGSPGVSAEGGGTPRPRRFELSARTLLTAAGLVASVWLMTRLWPVVLVVALALILVGTLNPIVARLERHGVRRQLAVGLIVLALMVLGAGFALVTAPALWAQVSEMVQSMPRLQIRLADFLAGHPATATVAEGIRHFKPQDVLADLGRRAVSYSSQVVLLLGYGATSVALALYLLLDPERAQGGLFSVVPRRFHVRLARILLNLETIVGGYMRGQVLTSLFMMVFVFGLLTACRIPNALALAVFAGVTDVIPLIGGLLALTPVVLSAMPRGSAITVIVLVAMIVYQELENRFIIPRVYGRVLRLSAAAVTVALLVGTQLLGVLGALLALPLAAAVRMVVQELRVELPGETVSNNEILARDERAETEYAHLAAGAPAKEAAAIAVQIAEGIRKQDATPPPAVEAVAVSVTTSRP
jgi:predicted PurR-regulated permease PerM